MKSFVLNLRTEANPIGDLIFGQTRGRVLALLYGHSEDRFFVREISRHIGTAVGSVQRELQTLEGVGLIERSASGKQVYYQANRKHPVFPEIHSLIAKTVGVYQHLRSALAPLSDRITLAFVYGSVAKGEERAASDVDMIIVGDVALDEVLTQLEPAERTIGREINPTVYTAKEFDLKVQAGNSFLEAVMKGKIIVLIGGRDELGKVG